MILPTIIRTTQESLKTVPQSYREGALGLGAGKWHMIPHRGASQRSGRYCHRLHPGRGPDRGESAALLFTAGFGTVLYSFAQSLNNSSATLTVALYLYANERGETEIAFAIAAIPDDPDPDHQPGRRSCGTAAEEVRGAGLIRPTLIRQRSNLNGKYHPVCPTAEFILW